MHTIHYAMRAVIDVRCIQRYAELNKVSVKHAGLGHLQQYDIPGIDLNASDAYLHSCQQSYHTHHALACRSYGAVYRAERRTDGMEVAVKIIPADNPADLLKEVDIMLACTSPYIVRLHDCYYKVSVASPNHRRYERCVRCSWKYGRRR